MYISVYHLTEMQGFEHQTILDAIRSGNSSLLEVCVRDHVMSAGRGVIEFLKHREANVDARQPVATLARNKVGALEDQSEGR
jgi:DNA-binding GntR family transcriptional regulator